ncbi:hypothetical protein DMUE_0003 [Dictyocoela muelleri]|nr:hypothetical protein DMUE_0003 [Dictyocoela muelleri]
MIIIDFEQAALNAFQIVFPQSKVFGCFFHFCQNMYKNVNTNKLSQNYKNDSEFRNDVKMMMSFSFLPPGLIEIYSKEYENYLKTRKHYDNIKIIWWWYKNLYLKENLNERKTVFNSTFWSSHKRILSSSPLTTNEIEGWHRSLNFNVGISHPNIPILINA